MPPPLATAVGHCGDVIAAGMEWWRGRTCKTSSSIEDSARKLHHLCNQQKIHRADLRDSLKGKRCGPGRGGNDEEDDDAEKGDGEGRGCGEDDQGYL